MKAVSHIFESNKSKGWTVRKLVLALILALAVVIGALTAANAATEAATEPDQKEIKYAAQLLLPANVPPAKAARTDCDLTIGYKGKNLLGLGKERVVSGKAIIYANLKSISISEIGEVRKELDNARYEVEGVDPDSNENFRSITISCPLKDGRLYMTVVKN
ncbi:MAG: hypothetical protein AB1553_05670 [Nitrospirota bacterium]